VPHEVGLLLGIVHRQQEVEVRAQEDRGMAADWEAGLGSAQDSYDDLIQGRARTQQELGLVGPDSHLDDGAPGGHKTQ
jgi:hypothetical protein